MAQPILGTKYKMTTDKQLEWANSKAGRIGLHLLALNRDYKFKWHLKGIIREII